MAGSRVYSVCAYDNPSLIGEALWYPDPPSDTFVVRDMVVVNNSATPCAAVITAESGAVLWIAEPALPAPWAQWQGRQVLNPGDHLAITVYGVAASVRISGYLLSP